MKTVTDEVRNRVLKQHSRAITHMRQQMEYKRFGLILGAGASVDLGFPSWSTLIERIATHPDIKARTLLSKSGKGGHTSRSQLLFQRFKTRHRQRATQDDLHYNRFDMKIRAGWQKIVHDALYDGVPADIDKLIERDHYLWAFLDVIKQNRLTVNYNFDNSLQQMLAKSRTADERERTRGYVTVWDPNIQFPPRRAIIYHPNGFLPRRLQEHTSEQLVFLEDAFADQLIESMAGHYAYLASHIGQTTCLLMGLSLEDPTLKHLLRQNARLHPGHYHYYIAFRNDGASRDSRYEDAVRGSNFEVYNLITLFLTRQEIAALGTLLGMPNNEFRRLNEELGEPSVYRFFLTGSVSVGKTTAVSHFGSLATHDEWLEPLPAGMEKDPELVNDKTIEDIDQWVASQLGRKNVALLDDSDGVHIIDRAPLDAFAFTPKDEWVNKAKLIKSRVSPGEARRRRLCPGHIILMLGDPEVMAVRAISRQRVTDAEKLNKQQSLLQVVYDIHRGGITEVDTREKSISQVAAEIGRIVHLLAYEEADMHKWLNEIEAGSIRMPEGVEE